jgi:hypothetical protein
VKVIAAQNEDLEVILVSAATPNWQVTGTVIAPLSVSLGGTGATTLTGLVLGNDTAAMTGVTTSAGIAGALSDETGTGALVLGTRPTLSLQDSTTTFQDNGDTTKQAQLQLSGITTGTTRTYTLPDQSSTLAVTGNNLSVFAATTSAQLAGVLSDETGTGAVVLGTRPTISLQDSTTTFQDNGDNTKQLQVQLSGITTGTTRTATFPDADITVTGTATTQTLTNKTLDLASNTLTGTLAQFNTAVSDADLLPDPGSNGLVARTGATTTANRTISAGAGLAGSNLDGVSGNPTLITASGEADFLASGALTCGAATQGKMQVHTTPLQYCDNAGTPTLRYSAYGDSAGAATSVANDSVALGTKTTGNYVGDVTAGAGLSKTSSASEGQTVDLAVASTEANFLTDGGASDLTCGGSNQGKAQVMDNGDLQYCDGATTSVLRKAALQATTVTVAGTANEITSSAGAQDLSANRTWTLSIPATFDISGKTATAPIKAGTSAATPGACLASKELYIKTDATAGQQLFLCNGAGNGFNLVGDGGAGSALADPGGNGVVVRTAANTTINRTLTGTANQVSISNGDGVSGNPTFSVPSSAQLSVAKLTNLTSNGFVKTSGGDGTLSVDTATYSTASSSDTLTNKTLDVEGTGNVITTVSKIWLPAVGCAGTTGSLLWDTLATNAPTATCSAGSTETTMMRGVADFPDSDGDYSLQQTISLPDDWTGAIDAKVKYRTTATSGNTVWQLTTACRADAEVDDVAYNTATAFTADAAKGTTNQLNDATATGIVTTGCAAGELMHLKLFRNRTHASDTITGVVSFVGLELTMRRAQ